MSRMAESKPVSAAVGSDAEVFLSASEEEAPQQEVTPELLNALVKQVEFYFSDANLPTDKKLLKQIRKDSEGYVPVKLFANFRKVRALSKDVGIITEALRLATLLELSVDAKRVRRIVPVPEYDVSDIQKRTIVVENLPGNPSPTIESVTEVFRMYGRVKLVRICSRESKGKLPSWLTSSCQSMSGQQHAYVEFEEEEGAVLASAALAAEGDASDGTVQVRRLLNCIAEHRERRSGAGTGSSYGGSSITIGSRKGSRDVSPLGSRAGGSRRSSGGGSGSFSYGGSGAGLWGSASSGGAAPDHYPPFHHSYGGAYEHNPGSRRGSGGGCAPPQPPPRRSCDSAPPSELLPAAIATAAPGAAAAPTVQTARLNIYRPPAKRLSDGYNPSSSAGSDVLLQRSCGGSFNSNGGTAPSAPASPVPFPPPPPPPRAVPAAPATSSPPLATRGVSVGGGKPPAHPPAALATNALAEAIAAAQAERRASEAGAKVAEVHITNTTSAAAVAAALAPMARAAPIAPKFLLDLGVRGRSAAGTAPALEGAISSPRQTTGAVGAAAAPVAPVPAVVAAALPRNTQMVANVEDFINNILARPASRSTPAAQVPTAAARKAAAAAVHKPAQAQAEPVDAAVAVAGILASALRRPVHAAVVTTSPPSAPAPTKSAAVISDPPAALTHIPAAPIVFITAVAADEAVVNAIPIMDMDLEHAVTVTVHRCPADEKALKTDPQPCPPAAVSTISSSTVSSAASSPRETCDVVTHLVLQSRSGGAAQRPHAPQQLKTGGKRVTRREYAQWAAATPEFRAEAASKYGAAADVTAMVSTGGLARFSAGGIASTTASPLSFGGAVTSSISDGGAMASPAHTPAPHAPSWHVARGPDGSRGFSGRRSLAA